VDLVFLGYATAMASVGRSTLASCAKLNESNLNHKAIEVMNINH
jgi:hypothetical protein